MNEYVETKYLAEKWGVSQSTITKWCRLKMISGAEQDAPGSPWRIPIDSERPTERRKVKTK